MDLIELDRQLSEASAKVRRRDKLQADEAQVMRQLEEARSEIKKWDGTIAGTAKKLKDLDSASLGYLFGTLFGDRMDRINDEKERLLKQKLKRDECAAAVEPLEQELVALRDELATLSDAGSVHDDLLTKKAEVLKARGDETATRLLELGEKIAGWETVDREIPEAIEAGKAVLPHLEAAIRDLSGARSWGHVDMLGGGLLTGLAKHGNIDGARNHVNNAQICMRRFDRELNDVTSSKVDLSMHIDGFSVFADLFFDGLITDWFVQSKINNSLERVEFAQKEVQSVIGQLAARGAEISAELATMREERATLVEQLK